LGVRYRIDETGTLGAAAQSSVDVTLATVWFTLFVGVVFIALGTRGQQRWLQFWGVLTCLACAV